MDYQESFAGRHALTGSLIGKGNLITTARDTIIENDEVILSLRTLPLSKIKELFDIAETIRRGKERLSEERRRMHAAKLNGRIESPVNLRYRSDITWQYTQWYIEHEIKDTLFPPGKSFYSKEKRYLRGIDNVYLYKNKLIIIQNGEQKELIFGEDKRVVINKKKYSRRKIATLFLFPLYKCYVKDNIPYKEHVDDFTVKELFEYLADVEHHEVEKMLRGQKFFVKQDGCYYHYDCEQLFSPLFVSDLRWLFVRSNKDFRKYYSEESILLRHWFDINSADEIIISGKDKRYVRNSYELLVRHYWNKDFSEWIYDNNPSERRRKVMERKMISESKFEEYYLFGLPNAIVTEWFYKVLKRIKKRTIRKD